MKLLLLALLTLSAVVSLPTNHLLNKHHLSQILKGALDGKHRVEGSAEFDLIWNEFVGVVQASSNTLYTALVSSKEVLAGAENAEAVTKEVLEVSEAGYEEVAWVVMETYFLLNPQDSLEQTALRIHNTWANANAVIARTMSDVETIVGKEAPEVLQQIKALNVNISNEFQSNVSALLELISPYLPESQ